MHYPFYANHDDMGSQGSVDPLLHRDSVRVQPHRVQPDRSVGSNQRLQEKRGCEIVVRYGWRLGLRYRVEDRRPISCWRASTAPTRLRGKRVVTARIKALAPRSNDPANNGRKLRLNS